jgi:hypothetical protein
MIPLSVVRHGVMMYMMLTIRIREIARKLGYKQENWYCQFTI